MARELQRARSQPLPTLKSYTLLMAAIALMHRLSPDDFEEARKLLQSSDRPRAAPADPAGVARQMARAARSAGLVGRSAARTRISRCECTKRALDADPDCSLALAIDGFVHTNLLKRLDIAQERYELAHPDQSEQCAAHGCSRARCTRSWTRASGGRVHRAGA